MKPRPLTPDEAKRSLANRLGRRVDGLRQRAVRLGLRPIRVFLVWEKFTGGERGAGERQLLRRIEILPTPKVDDLSNVGLHPMIAGVVQDGTVRVSKISSSFTYDQLRGLFVPEAHEDQIPEPYDFYWEMYEDGRGDPDPVRQKFRVSGQPSRRAGKVDWMVTLERVSGDNDRHGHPAY